MEPGQADRSLVERVKRALAPRVEILEAYLFGSHARGDAHGQSDIDIAVYVDEARTEAGPFGYQADLTTHLMDALETNAVDVVGLNTAPPLLYHRVLRDGVRLLSRDLRATTTRAGQALSRYFDFIPQLEKMDAARRFAAGKGPPVTPDRISGRRPRPDRPDAERVPLRLRGVREPRRTVARGMTLQDLYAVLQHAPEL